MRDFWNINMTKLEEAMDIDEMIAEEVAQAMTIGDTLESTEIVA